MGDNTGIDELLRWAESLAGIARTGLGFSASLFERERFDEILRIAADIRVAAEQRLTGNGDLGEGREALVHEWLGAVRPGVAGYVTPRVSIGAIVGNEEGELLLVRRPDSGYWLYPTGWADVGYSAAEMAIKEVAEETGLVVETERLVMVLDGLQVGMSSSPLYSLVFLCRLIGGELAAHPLECLEIGWFARDSLPSPLAGADRWVEHAFGALNDGESGVLFDRPRSPAWRS